MKDRLFTLLDVLQVTPAQFAERLGIERSTLSHIKSERSKPSLDLVTKVLQSYPDISPEWLILGVGSMRKDVSEAVEPDLFSQPIAVESPVVMAPLPKEDAVTTSQESVVETKVSGVDVERQVRSERHIERILVFYSDKTFDEYVK